MNSHRNPFLRDSESGMRSQTVQNRNTLPEDGHLSHAHSPRALEAIISAVNRLKRSESKFSKHIWEGDRDRPFGEIDRNSLAAETACSAEERVLLLQEVLHTLSRLRDSATEAHKFAQLQTLSQSGFAKLPNELVLRIISCSYDGPVFSDDHSYRRHFQTLSSVCSRFRSIIVAHAPFWTRISNDLRPDMVGVYLTRSRTAPLSITIVHSDELKPYSLVFLHKVLPSRNRWVSFRLDYSEFCPIHKWSTSHVEEVYEYLNDVSLPALEELDIRLPPSEDSEETQWALENFHPYSTWKAPALKELHGRDMLPMVNTSFKLTCCYLIISHWYWHSPSDPLMRFMEFLRSQPCLERLFVIMEHFPSESSFPVGEPVNMPSLRKLEINANCHAGRADFVSALVIPSMLQSLQMPAIEELNVGFPIADENFQLHSIFPKYNDYTCLREFSLALHEDRDADFVGCTEPFEVIFSRMRNLTRLDIIAKGVEILQLSPNCNVQSPPLETIRLSCEDFDVYKLRAVVELLQNGPHWEKFKTLDLYGDWMESDLEELESIQESLPLEMLRMNMF